MGVFDSETLFSRFGGFWPLQGANGFAILRTIVKPLWQLPPLQAKNPPTFSVKSHPQKGMWKNTLHFLRRGGWGCIFWWPTRQEFYTPPPLCAPPPLKGIFRGGGVHMGVYKIWPRSTPPLKKLLMQKNSWGIILGGNATNSRNQLRKRILWVWELLSRELRKFRVTQHGRVWGLCSR